MYRAATTLAHDTRSARHQLYLVPSTHQVCEVLHPASNHEYHEPFTNRAPETGYNLDQRPVAVFWISLRPLTDHRLWCGARASREGRGNTPGVGGWDTRVRPVR